MSSNTFINRNGDSTRPTTDGGVDHIGAAEKLAPGHGQDAAPHRGNACPMPTSAPKQRGMTNRPLSA